MRHLIRTTVALTLGLVALGTSALAEDDCKDNCEHDDHMTVEESPGGGGSTVGTGVTKIVKASMDAGQWDDDDEDWDFDAISDACMDEWEDFVNAFDAYSAQLDTWHGKKLLWEFSSYETAMDAAEALHGESYDPQDMDALANPFYDAYMESYLDLHEALWALRQCQKENWVYPDQREEWPADGPQ